MHTSLSSRSKGAAIYLDEIESLECDRQWCLAADVGLVVVYMSAVEKELHASDFIFANSTGEALCIFFASRSFSLSVDQTKKLFVLTSIGMKEASITDISFTLSKYPTIYQGPLHYS